MCRSNAAVAPHSISSLVFGPLNVVRKILVFLVEYNIDILITARTFGVAG